MTSLARLSVDVVANTRDAVRGLDFITGKLFAVGKAGGAATVGVAGIAQLAPVIAQMGPAAGVAAGGATLLAQGMGTLKLATAGLKTEAPGLIKQVTDLGSSFQKTAANGIKGGLQTALTNLRPTLEVARRGIGDTSKVLGDLAVSASKSFSTPFFRGQLTSIMQANNFAIGNFGQAGISLAHVFVDIADASEPIIRQLSRLARSFSEHAAGAIRAKLTTGELTDEIQNGVDRIGQLVRTVSNFAVGFRNFFRAARSDSVDAGDSMESFSEKFRKFLSDANNLQKVSAFFDGFRSAVTTAFTFSRHAVEDFWSGFTTGRVQQISPVSDAIQAFGARMRLLWNFLTNDLIPTIAKLGSWFLTYLLPPIQEVSGIITQTLIGALSSLFSVIRSNGEPLFRALGNVLSTIVVPIFRDLQGVLNRYVIPAIDYLARTVLKSAAGAFNDLASKIKQHPELLRTIHDLFATVGWVVKNILAPAIGFLAKIVFPALVIGITTTINILRFFELAWLHLASLVLDAVHLILVQAKMMADGILIAVTAMLNTLGKMPGPFGAPFRSAAKHVKDFRSDFDNAMNGVIGKTKDAHGKVSDEIYRLSGDLDRDWSRMLAAGRDFAGKLPKVIGASLGANRRDATSQMSSIVNDMQRTLNGLHGQTIKLSVQEIVASQTFSTQRNALFGGFASGGRIPGFGGGDTVPALLEPGEAVVDKHRTRALAPLFGAMGVPGFAAGGFIGINEKVSHPNTGTVVTIGAQAGAHMMERAFEHIGGIFGLLGIAGGIGGGVGGFGVGGGIGSLVGVQRWSGVASAALKLAGQSLSWLPLLLRRMNQESGGNPRAINLTDINARNGDPSRGLMQTIGSTFNAYANGLRSRGIYDPLANIFASIRYTLARYGTLAAWGRPGGYDAGGILKPGTTLTTNNTGKPEQILTPDQTVAWQGFVKMWTRLSPGSQRQVGSYFQLFNRVGASAFQSSTGGLTSAAALGRFAASGGSGGVTNIYQVEGSIVSDWQLAQRVTEIQRRDPRNR